MPDADPTEPTVVPDMRVSALPAFDRVQQRSVPAREPRSRRSWLFLLALLVLVGGAATAWWVWPDAPEAGDVLVHLVESADRFQPDLVTTRPDDARDLVFDALGWDVVPPDLPSLTIVGVGIPSIGTLRPSASAEPAEVQVPTFRYEGTDGEEAVVFAYDYILLDRVRTAFDLSEATYAVLSEPTPVDSRVVEGRFVITWRERAMIFSAITTDEAAAERIRQAVAS